MDKSKIKKIVLAYSGGLDTSIIIPWLKENYNNPEIIAVSGNVGQADELEGLEEKALKTGASKLIVADLVDEMMDEIVIPALKMDAKYETYLLGTAFARPIIAKKLCEVAKAEGADAIAHGATGKGNDQVRFELAIKRFLPDIPIIAPWREWDIKSRDEEIDYAEAHKIPLKISRETNYSKDKNIWHLSHEGLDLEDPANEPNLDKPGFLEMGVSPYAAPDKPEYVSIDFEAGAPVGLNGVKMKPADIVWKLNEIGGRNGVGIIDIVENRLVGMKDRGVYETPGGTILYFAHAQLEMITMDKDTLHLKQKLAVDFADMIYNGKWYTPLQEALCAFANEANKYVTGTVKLKLYKGNIIPAGTTSPCTLYSENLVTFGESDYDQSQAAGFINLWGLPITVHAMREQGKLYTPPAKHTHTRGPGFFPDLFAFYCLRCTPEPQAA
ncbi:MAG: argininosuccinate synthase, partial [Synergistaceae bacterium]|nr:argininosuccinate synthase [Synergistaceae bacterium]